MAMIGRPAELVRAEKYAEQFLATALKVISHLPICIRQEPENWPVGLCSNIIIK